MHGTSEYAASTEMGEYVPDRVQDRLTVDTQRLQLISPPPEEILDLRRASGLRLITNVTEVETGSANKRKRAPPSPAKALAELNTTPMPQSTPNPKPRKQRHLGVPSLESPMQPSTKGPRRRSATPIPPYEPPPDIFTTPREVFLNAPSTKKSSKRKGSVGRSTKPKPKILELRVNTSLRVKQELPDDLDLLAPMPPPSPTDDPLLLSGPPEPEHMSEVQGEIPMVQATTWESTRSSSVGVSEIPLPPSSPIVEAVYGWSDSDDDRGEVEGEGEFTGKWKMAIVPTKQDPPSTVTRTRQEHWGRPISPFPRLELVSEEEEEEEIVRQISMEPEEPEVGEQCAIEEEEVRRMSMEPEIDEPEVEDQGAIEEEEVRQISMEPEGDEPEVWDQGVIEEEVGQVSMEPEPEVGVIPLHELNGEDGRSETDDEEGLVKITSADPKAAARAVAILKQHDYDCFTKLTKKRRSLDLAKESRRKSVTSSGIQKSIDRRQRRSNVGVIGDKVYIPGSPVVTLPELLRQAEDEISMLAGSSPRSRTPCWDAVRFATPISSELFEDERMYAPGPRDWTKEDWKLLDACFTDQRLASGDYCTLAPVDTILFQDVVVRFIEAVGGESLIETFGETWSRDNLMVRTKALLKKQRSRRVASPSTPISSVSFSFPSMMTDSPCIEVPDFTPLRQNQVQIRNLIGDSEARQGRIPLTLLAPRYSHILEEVESTANGDCSTDYLEVDMTDSDEQMTTTPLETAQDLVNDSEQFYRSSADQEVFPPQQVPPDPTNHLRNRFRGFFSSYLPILSKQPLRKKSNQTSGPRRPGLPLPPPSILEKPRGPVTTPARPLAVRAPHPKDTVHLNHILPPPSNIPRVKSVPKRLVELAPVPQSAITIPRDVVRSRRSSGSSVKDLVKGFEQLEKTADRKSIGTVPHAKANMRPIWKP